MKTFDIRRSNERALKITRNAIDTNKADHIILGMLVLADALKELNKYNYKTSTPTVKVCGSET